MISACSEDQGRINLLVPNRRVSIRFHMSCEFNMNWAEPREARNWIRSQRKKMPWYIIPGMFIMMTVIFQLMFNNKHSLVLIAF